MNLIPGPLKGVVNDIEDSVGDAAGAIGDKAGDAAGAIGDKVGDAAGAIGDRAGDAAEAVGDAAAAIGDKAMDAAAAIGDKASAIGHKAIEVASELLSFIGKQTLCGNLWRLNDANFRVANAISGGRLWREPSTGALSASALMVVVEGAKLECEHGDTPSALKATGSEFTVAGMRGCTVNDHRVAKNIQKFGRCDKLFQRACRPHTPTPWAPPTEAILIGGPALLHNAARLVCTIGGSPCISIVDAGQAGLSLGEAETMLLTARINALDVPSDVKARMLEDLVESTSPSQRVLLRDLFERLDDATLKEALSGAHLKMHDGGALYHRFSPNGAYSRPSSHAQQEHDVGFDLPGGGTILIAQDIEDPSITHVQFERHGLRSHPFKHTLDYCVGGQRGPYGESLHTDKDPIEVP